MIKIQNIARFIKKNLEKMKLLRSILEKRKFHLSNITSFFIYDGQSI